LKRFSKRSQQRDAVVKEMEQKLGRKLSNNAIGLAVHQSRAEKVKGISTAEVREKQLAQLQPDELQALQKLCASVQRTRQPHLARLENQVLNYAVAHVFERWSVVPEHELLNVALAQRPGAVDLSRLKEAFGQSPELVKTDRGFSTQAILETETQRSTLVAIRWGRSIISIKPRCRNTGMAEPFGFRWNVTQPLKFGFREQPFRTDA
jgi:hypothetical protein